MEVIEKQDAIKALKAIKHALLGIEILYPGNRQKYREQIKDMMDITDEWIKHLTNLPSVQLIRCKDCKYNTEEHKCINPDSFFIIPGDEDFCSYAKRRTDEPN